MRSSLFWMLFTLTTVTAAVSGAELRFDLGQAGDNPPPGFRSTLSGRGKPGQWRVLLDDTKSQLEPLTAGGPASAKRAVLAQTARDPTDDHFPMLIYDQEEFADFTLTTQFKIVEGAVEQMAGLAFRIQDERNYYYVRANALGNNVYFFWFVNGELLGPIGSKVPISRGVWHELSVECKGSFITCALDGKVVIPQLQRDNFSKGKIGFWTKSDSVSYFAEPRIVYTPRVVPGQALVEKVAKRYGRLEGLKIFVAGSAPDSPRLIASMDTKELGNQGNPTVQDVIASGKIYSEKSKEGYDVTMPLRDRNGDLIAAVRVELKAFLGQTEANAIARARLIVQEIQHAVQSLQDLTE